MNCAIREPPPICPMCSNDVLDVPHILLKCAQVQELRINNMKAYSEKGDLTLAKLLGCTIVAIDIFRFLREINVYDQIQP